MLLDIFYYFLDLLFQLPVLVVNFFTPYTSGVISQFVSFMATVTAQLEVIFSAVIGLEPIIPVTFMLTCASIVFIMEVFILNKTLLLWTMQAFRFLKSIIIGLS